jgi:hypothetical protein
MKLLHEVLRQAAVLARSLRFYFTLLIITRQVVCAATPPGAGCNSSSKTRYSIGSRPPVEAKKYQHTRPMHYACGAAAF